MSEHMSYAQALRAGFAHLMSNHSEVFTIGQGLWAPWYVGTSMKDLDKEFGLERVIDSPVSEDACTGAALGAALMGYRPIVIHPRIDFMILAVDQIVNQAAKWRHMFGGRVSVPLTVRGIVNRGGEQGAQHSQALHSWFAHIPGLRVVMPATVQDARDLLVASVLSDDPVLFIDDRWLYELEADLGPVKELDLHLEGPKLVREGSDVTLVGASYSAELCLQTAEVLDKQGVSSDVIDLRVVNPLDCSAVVESVRKTGALAVVDGGWETCGLAGEVIAKVVESAGPAIFGKSPLRITLPAAPAPTSKVLETNYYPTTHFIVDRVTQMLNGSAAEPVARY